MKPIIRFNSIVISITTLIMYSLWALLSSQIFNSATNKLIIIIISFFTSLGFYRTIFKLLSFVLGKWKFFKKKIYGNYFLEGTWLGFFIGHDGNVRYFYEVFEQSLDSTVITGKAFRDDGSIHGIWKAYDPIIDINLGKMTYYYEADVFKNTFINPGFASFYLERETKDGEAKKLTGFSSDLFDSHKLIAHEEKCGKNTLLDNESLLAKAKELYENNKEYYK